MTGPTRNTRLRYISAKKADDLELFVNRLPYRVQIYSIVYQPKAGLWFMWYVPDDLETRVTGSVKL